MALMMTLAMTAPLLCSTADPTIRRGSDLRWSNEGFYLNVGASPGAAFRSDGFNPLIRYDAELGMRWSSSNTSVSFGANPWVVQRLEAHGATGGLFGVTSIRHRNVYGRAGAGVQIGPPGTIDDNDVRASVAALVGLGLESRGDDVRGRFGFDYVASYDKAGRINNTVFFVLALRFG